MRNKGVAEESLRLALIELWGEGCHAQAASENKTLRRDILFILLGPYLIESFLAGWTDGETTRLSPMCRGFEFLEEATPFLYWVTR